MILGNLQKGVETARKILRLAIPRIPRKRDCICASALKDAIVTSPKYMPPEAKEKLKLLLGKYLNKGGIG
jgi:5'-methylthioadenosine phosphorylase